MANKFRFPFPIYGENRSEPQSEQPSQTVVNLSNVRPYDTDDLRVRGGQRPGLKKWGNGDNVAGGTSIVADIISVTYMVPNG